MRLLKAMLHPYTRNQFTHHAHSNYALGMDTLHHANITLIQYIEKNGIESREVMQDPLTSIESIWFMPKHNEMIHNTMASSDSP